MILLRWQIILFLSINKCLIKATLPEELPAWSESEYLEIGLIILGLFYNNLIMRNIS